MFSLISGFIDWYFAKTEVNLLVLGLDNAGKTTFLKLCYADLIAASGQVRVFDQNIGTMDRDAIAFAFLIVVLMIRPHGLFARA